MLQVTRDHSIANRPPFRASVTVNTCLWAVVVRVTRCGLPLVPGSRAGLSAPFLQLLDLGGPLAPYRASTARYRLSTPYCIQARHVVSSARRQLGTPIFMYQPPRGLPLASRPEAHARENDLPQWPPSPALGPGLSAWSVRLVCPPGLSSSKGWRLPTGKRGGGERVRSKKMHVSDESNSLRHGREHTQKRARQQQAVASGTTLARGVTWQPKEDEQGGAGSSGLVKV